jgi:hypothetical protein
MQGLAMSASASITGFLATKTAEARVDLAHSLLAIFRMTRNLLKENRQQSARALTLYPKRPLITADHAHHAKGLSTLDYSPAMACPAVAVILKNPTVRKRHSVSSFGRQKVSASARICGWPGGLITLP